MDLEDCYRLLGLRSGASFADIKASYRRLAQQYHPDINPDDTKAKEKFIAVTEAYKLLLHKIPQQETAQPSNKSPVVENQPTRATRPQTATKEKLKEKAKPPSFSEIEQRLKWRTYEQLQQFLKEKRFPQAISLAEALAQRLPEDAEVRQWQAISYQIWGRSLIAEKQPLKARIYLKKALKTDPYNKSLWDEVQRDFQMLENMF
ncbi:J domain-containing protein [Brasilonema octagenarum]|uniref:Molecular chaperone DnaJ n=1 Tax=Brasilonema octagenarum UFV-OR1 TaxID=417115 RepID=A0ABX1MBE2_9CYAN|nr:J domain-containing protein [Brasilonema octagenarum]NMF64346.1 molecular chaperone DnaJ [Brasilonema octagenarum UFV-OR1]